MNNFFTHCRNLWVQLLSSAHLYGDDLDSRSRLHTFVGALVYNIVFNLLNGTFLTGFFLAIGADANQVNTIILVLSVCNLLQIISPLILSHIKRRKSLLIILRGTAHFLNIIVLPLLALSGMDKEMLFPLAAVILGIGQCLIAFINPGIQVWHIRNIPSDKQLGYFSFLTVINCISVYIFLFFGGIMVDGLVAVLGQAVGLPVLRIGMLLFAVLDVFLLTRIHEYPPEEKPAKVSRFFVKMWRCLRDCPAYGKVILGASLWNFVANIPSQYYNTYILDNVGLSYTFINSITLFNVVVVLLFTPPWKKFIGWKGLRGCLFLSFLLYAPHAIGLALVTKTTVSLYPVSIIYNLIFAAGINLAFSVVPYLNLPEEERTIYLALYNTGCALSALLGVLFGRMVFSILQGFGKIALFGAEIVPAQILMMIFSVACVGVAVAFFRLLKSCDKQS